MGRKKNKNKNLLSSKLDNSIYTNILLSSGFSSFKIAHTLLEEIGSVDIVSDSKNIRSLLKMPYNEDSVSMMVHRIGNTLLIDEFDINKHLMTQTEDDTWDWLRLFFNNHILQSSDEKEIDLEINKRTLYTKFLEHNNELQDVFKQSPLSFSFSPEDLYLDNLKTNQNVLWKFEGLQMLLGTDLPIFNSGNNSYQSLRLRDISIIDYNKNVSTAIDYWLDNLMCDVPEVNICYHSNGIVQKYELVKTENIPHLKNAEFSTNTMSDIVTNLLSFLKSKAIKAGHTYWFLKGQNNKIIKFYDLTSLCPKSLVEGKNPFNVPVSMLLFHVVCKSKDYLKDDKQLCSDNINILVNVCLQMLNKTKHSQIVTSIMYTVSDLYIPQCISDTCNLEVINAMNKKPLMLQLKSNNNLSFTPNDNKQIFETNKYYFCLPTGYIHTLISQEPECYPLPEYQCMRFEERCREALNYVGSGLSCLKYSKNLDSQSINEETMKKIEETTAAFSETTIFSEIINTNHAKVINKNNKNKKCKRNKGNIIKNNDNTKQVIAETIPTMSDAKDNILWKQQLESLLYEKASLCYSLLAEYDYERCRFGSALKHFRCALECQLYVTTKNIDKRIASILRWCGDCYVAIGENWHVGKNYMTEYKINDWYNFEINEILEKKSISHIHKDLILIKIEIQSKKHALIIAEECYSRSWELCDIEPNNNILNNRIFTLNSELILCYTTEVQNVLITSLKSSSEVQKILQDCQYYFLRAIEKFKKMNKPILISSLYLDMGIKFIMLSKLTEEYNFKNMAVEHLQKGLTVLGSRSIFPELWDCISWELSTTTYVFATKLDVRASVILETDKIQKYIMDLSMKALQYCELKNDDVVLRRIHTYRAGRLHCQLANMYLSCLRLSKIVGTQKYKVDYHQCIVHYNRSYELFLKESYSVDCFEVLLHTIEFDQLQIERTNMNSFKVKICISTIKIMEQCIIHIQYIINNQMDLVDYVDNSDQNRCYNTENITTLLMRLEGKLQFILKCLIKLAMDETPRFVNKLDELKMIYENLLRKNEDRLSLHILKILTQISDL